MRSTRAIWIFDDAFKELTYMSVRSFATQCDWKISLVYCGEEIERIKPLFSDISRDLDWVIYRPDVSIFPSHLQATIINRLARFSICEQYVDELLLLVDADIVFSNLLSKQIASTSAEIQEYSKNEATVAGVAEYDEARNAYLFFNKKNARGDALKISEGKKKRAFRHIFGPKWSSLLKQPQFNNGLLFFNNARPIIRKWKEYYLKQLLQNDVNPADDQVSLAAAIKALNINPFNLPATWNSLGRTSGPFIAFHAWAGKWQNDMKDIFRNAEELTEFAAICKSQIEHWPEAHMSALIHRLERRPTYYKRIPGYFDYGGIYQDIVRHTTSGHFVEVGTYMGRSTCFMAELIKASQKQIKFDSIDHYCRKDTSLPSVQKDMKRAGVARFVKLKKGHSRELVAHYRINSLDFVFLDIEQHSVDFMEELENWYGKLKPGGVLAGYDYTIHDTVNAGLKCYIQEFARSKELSVHTYKQRFIIQKIPIHTYDTV